MNLGQIRGTLRRRVGNPTEGDKPNALLNEFINLAYQGDLSDMFPFHATRDRLRFSTIIGTNIYAVPSNYTTVHAAWNRTKRREIRKADYIRTFNLDTIASNDPAPGSVIRYSRFQDSVQFYPMPGEVEELELFCTKTPDPLVGDNDVPVFPVAWHRGIWMMARWHYWDDAQDFGKAQYALDSFNAWAATKTNEFQQELSAFERSVEVPTLGRWRESNGRMMSSDQWRRAEW